ncbi:MAG: hypothetical protein JNL21_16375 [Myxococcales bacterium]|nr:hypothetical protein [Myxococcales bacterium]
MRSSPIAAAAIVALACGSTPEGRPPPGLPLPAVSGQHAVAPGALPKPAAGRVLLAPTTPTPLPIVLFEIEGEDAVLAVSDAAGQEVSFAQRIGADMKLGPVLALPGAHVAGAFALQADGELTVVAAEGDALCASTFRGDERRAHGCSSIRPDVLARVPGRILALTAESPPDDDDKPVTTPPRPKKPAKPPPRKRRPKKEPTAVEKLFASGREREVMATFVLPDGSTPLDAEKTGLSFVEPMVGMGLISAARRGERVDLVFYEKGKKRGREKTGAIGVASLDEAGVLVEGSRRSFGESKLAAGFLTDLVDPTLHGFRDGSVLLSSRGPRGKCDATVVAPFVMQMIPDEDDCATDPRRFFRLAQTKRKGKHAPLAPRPADLERGAVRRATGQPRWDLTRVVLTEDRAFALTDDGIVSFTEGGAVARGAQPLVADRSRIFGGAIAPDGTAIALTSAGLVTADASGAVSRVDGAAPRLLARDDRPDVAALERRLAAKIGGAWIQAEGELRRLAPEPGPAKRTLHPDTAVLTGGASAGLLFDLAGATLAVSRITRDAEATEIGRASVTFGVGFDAVEQPDGGALVVGRERAARERVVVLRFDAQGRALGAHVTISIPEDGGGRLRLHGSPGGGAVLTEGAARSVVWLGDDGKVVAAAPWPAPSREAFCWDGAPLRSVVFGAKPGTFVESGGNSEPSTCVTTMELAPDGSLRFLGSTTASIHTRAELGVIAGAAPAPSQASRPLPAARAATRRELSPCPGDMVFVSPGLCVDRFESTLVDEGRGRYTSPDYPPTPAALSGAFGDFLTRRERIGDVLARAMPLPPFPAWQAEAPATLVAVSRAGVRPNGYVSGTLAKEACERAGKRLCVLEEWRRACRGEGGQLFPYGATHVQGTCNVNGPIHPAATLHDNASIGHLDPRLNRVEAGGVTVLHDTGTTKGCASRWGDDAIFDMVGNVDEWVDEKGGAFAGGFYARGTTNGCEALVSNHPEGYFDYSTGVRCCRDAAR